MARPVPIIQVVQPVQPVIVRHDIEVVHTKPAPVANEDPEQDSKILPLRPNSKKDFEQVPESKKDFDNSKKDFDSPVPIEKNDTNEEEPEFDRDSDVGRWRFDWQVAELVIYRDEFGKWPEDVPVETGLRSYYELRYFDEGTNRKGEKYAELYARHRLKRQLWVGEHKAGQISETELDTPTAESNVVFIRRAGSSN